jgi:hypothetical protein
VACGATAGADARFDRRVGISARGSLTLFGFPFIDRLMASCLQRLVPVTVQPLGEALAHPAYIGLATYRDLKREGLWDEQNDSTEPSDAPGTITSRSSDNREVIVTVTTPAGTSRLSRAAPTRDRLLDTRGASGRVNSALSKAFRKDRPEPLPHDS